MSWRDGLTGAALNIASTTANPLRVVAGPGTGKTFSLKRRVARLLEEGVNPRRILAVTFTRTAADNLIKELKALNVPGCERIHAGTLHAFCFSVLSAQGVFDFLNRFPRPVITFNKSAVMQFEGTPLLVDLINSGNFDNKRDCTKRIRAFEAAWARLQSDNPGWPTDPIDRDFHDKLLAWLIFHKAILIGELVPEALRYLRNNPLSRYLTDFDHVIVDEYQDLNKAEQTLIDLLSRTGNCAVVGDPDQSIYRFRHANPQGITEYSHLHPTTHDEPLTACRRCPSNVVEIANNLILNNYTGTEPDHLLPETPGRMGEVYLTQWRSLSEEVTEISAYVQFLLANRGYGPGDILILSPRRIIGYAIRDEIKDLNIPVHSFYHEELLESDEAQLTFCLLTLLVNIEDRVALRFWLGYESPSCLVNQYNKIREICEREGLSPVAVLQSIQLGQRTVQGVAKLLKRYNALLAALSELNGLVGQALVDRLFPQDKSWADSIREAISMFITDESGADIILSELKTRITQPEMPKEGDYVRIMSLQKSKGLTSKVVIVIGCIDGLIPTLGDASSPPEIRESFQEGRRLFYVAITRAAEILLISSSITLPRKLAYKMGAKVSYGKSRIARTISSPFLHDLGPSCPQSISGIAWKSNNYR